MSERWRPTLGQAGALFLTAVGGLLLVSLAAGGLDSLLVHAEFWLSTCYYLLFLLLPLALLAGGDAQRLDALRLTSGERPQTLRMLWLALLSLMLMLDLGELWYMLLEGLGLMPHGNIETLQSMPPWMQTVIACLLAPLCEELLFRGALLSAWQRRGNGRALLLTTVLFMLMHASLSGLPALLAIGALLGYVALKTDSIWNSVILHCGYNGLALLLTMAAGSLASESEAEEMALTELVNVPGTLISLLVVLALIWLSLRRMKKAEPLAGAAPRERLTVRAALPMLIGAALLTAVLLVDATGMAGL